LEDVSSELYVSVQKETGKVVAYIGKKSLIHYKVIKIV
jgi:hypothetical protein